ncbi:hypothetical protein BJ912DRAFT_966811 [Pholiota molesta]|nr:hypothetical protein BJ912DRAFT_966811 [Pholiota molesta]
MADVFNIDAVAPETPALQAAEVNEQPTPTVVTPAPTTTLETVVADESGPATTLDTVAPLADARGTTVMEMVTVAVSEAVDATPVVGLAGAPPPAPPETATTKEGEPAAVGDKRARPTELELGKDVAASAEEQLEQAEKETGKDVKKPRVDEAGAAEVQPAEKPAEGAEGEKEKKAPGRRGRPPKAAAAKKAKEAAAPGEEGAKPKRPVGRPRKGTTETAEKKGVEEKKAGDDTRPVRSTRSKA